MYGAVLKLDAVGYALHVVLGDVVVGPYVINLFLYKLGVCELGSKVAVVGEQEHTGGVAVETTYGIDAFLTRALDEIHDGETSVGVVARGDTVFGLVEKYVALLLEGHHLAVILHDIAVADLGAELGDYLAVDLDETLEDVFVGFAARAESSVGHELIETKLFIGIGQRSLVLDALGTRGETASALGHAILVLTGTFVLIAALTVVLIATLAVVLVAALTVVLIAALLTGLIATLLTGLVTTLLTGLVATLLTGLIAALLTGLVTALLTVVIVAGLIAALTVIVIAGLIAGGRS